MPNYRKEPIMLNIICLAGFAVLIAVGQLLFKKAGLIMRDQPLLDGVAAVASSPSLYFALILYGVATAIWIWILSRVPLSLAYPWIGVGVILVPLLAAYVYGERMNTMYWIGAALVAFGVVLTQWGTTS